MTDEEKKDEKEEEKSGGDSSSSELIERAEDAAEMLETAHERTEKLVVRQENIEARKKLAGKAEAGQEKEEEKKVETTDKEYAQKALDGEMNEK